MGGFIHCSVGFAQATLAQTTKIAVDVVTFPITTTCCIVSGASANVGWILSGKYFGDNSDDNRLIENEQFPSPDDEHDNIPGVLKFVFHISEIVMGAISPAFAKNRAERMNHCHHKETGGEIVTYSDRRRNIENETSTDDVTSTNDEFFDACDESVFFDAISVQTPTLDSINHSLSIKESGDIPKSITVEAEELTLFYLELSDLLQECHETDLSVYSLEKNNKGGAFFAINGNASPKDSFQNVLNVLVKSAINVTSDDHATVGNEASSWKPDGNTRKILQHHSIDRYSEHWCLHMLENEVLKWTGSFSNGIPALKTQGVVSMSPTELKELLLDSKRVQEFNKNSLGKKDLCVIPSDIGESKIVENAIKIPIVGIIVKTLTLTHWRQIDFGVKAGGEAGFIIVSRSVKKELNETETNPFYSISILRPVPNQPMKTELTNVAQVSCPSVPKFLVNRIGFMGATDFFINVRHLSTT